MEAKICPTCGDLNEDNWPLETGEGGCQMCNARIIPLTKGFNAIVDAEDFERVAALKWCASLCRGYAYGYRKQEGRTLYLHRFIVNAPEGMYVDHINGNTLDNRKVNLRVCSNSDNLRNRHSQSRAQSTFLGVYATKSGKRWRANVKVAGVEKHLGYFDSPVDAAKARDKAVIEMYGGFGRLNFPQEVIDE